MKQNFLKYTGKFSGKIARILIFSSILLALSPLAPQISYAGALTAAKDTITNSRPSASTTIGSAITAGDTTITVGSTTNILQGDTITLCGVACSPTETKVVAAVISATKLALTAGTTNAYTTSGNVYLKIITPHTITFTTRSAVSGGSFLVTFPATTSTGNPQSAGFDFNSLATSDVTLSGGTAGTIVITPASGTVSVPFTGTIAANTAITITVGNTHQLINPTKTAAAGTADTWTVSVNEKDSGANVIDNVSMMIGTIEAVVVTATVSPTFSFSINAVSSGTTVAGVSTNTTTTATTVPFGTITSGTSYTLAQFLSVSTNADTGYAVTAQEDGSLRKSNGTTVITDFGSTAADNNGVNGFGYSLQNKVGTDASFQYNDSARTFNSKGFQTTPVTLMSNSSAVSGNQVYVAYRVLIGATQPPGNYQNTVTYIATPSY